MFQETILIEVLFYSFDVPDTLRISQAGAYYKRLSTSLKRALFRGFKTCKHVEASAPPRRHPHRSLQNMSDCSDCNKILDGQQAAARCMARKQQRQPHSQNDHHNNNTCSGRSNILRSHGDMSTRFDGQ